MTEEVQTEGSPLSKMRSYQESLGLTRESGHGGGSRQSVRM